MLRAYASRTGTRRNLDVLRSAGWRLMVSAKGVLRNEGFPYALDNGAWTCFQQGKPFDGTAFGRAVDLLGDGADFVVLPDIVCGGYRSLELSLKWIDRLKGVDHLLLPVQNGMDPDRISPILSKRIGIFVGGDDTWKETTMSA